TLLWRLGPDELPGLGQTWAAPVVTRMRIEGAEQNDERLVVVLAGGYDQTQDDLAATPDETGNALFIVDAFTGSLLWHGGAAAATRRFSAMRYSIPADAKVIDLDANGFADRIYAADMGGQIWRFDIFN